MTQSPQNAVKLVAARSAHLGLVINIQRSLGRGSYGAVYAASRAEQAAADISAQPADGDSALAVKVIDIRALGPEDGRRMLREIRFAACFGTGMPLTRIVTCAGVILTSDLRAAGIVFDRWDAALSGLVRDIGQRLTNEHARWLMAQLLAGLRYVHDANVVHGDIKPENLLVAKNCKLAITDFGLARWAPDGQVRLEGGPVQTSWYRSPEVILELEYGTAADMWGAGCVFAELLRSCWPSRVRRDPPALFPGADESAEQLARIIAVVGDPTPAIARGDADVDTARAAAAAALAAATAAAAALRRDGGQTAPLERQFMHAPPLAVDLLTQLLRLDPAARPSARAALAHPYFDGLELPEVAAVDASTADIESLDLGEEPADGEPVPPLCGATIRAKLHDMVYPDLAWR
jgi:serine/threonine protein kinase